MIMTRKEILSMYKVQDGLIRDPGKFELEPIYTPYYWDKMADGMETETLDFPINEDETKSVDIFEVTAEDLAEFPELDGVAYIALEYSDQGFVQASELSVDDLNKLRLESEKEWQEYHEGEDFEDEKDGEEE